MKSSKISQGRNTSKKVGNNWATPHVCLADENRRFGAMVSMARQVASTGFEALGMSRPRFESNLSLLRHAFNPTDHLPVLNNFI